MNISRWRCCSLLSVIFATLVWFAEPHTSQAEDKPLDLSLYNRENLVAWCIVPFDNQKRGPEARARMLDEIGIRKLAYDYRAEHIPTFDAEIKALKKRNIELTAWWFPGSLNDEARMTLNIFKRHQVHPQLWITGGGAPVKNKTEQQARVKQEAARIRPIAEAAAEAGCQVALYNHGRWFGDPENQIEIIKELKLSNVGIVYNLHHAHDHLDRFESLLQKMKPYLLALNLNGMVPAGDKQGQKIVPIGQGELDLKLLEIIARSGWKGPIGILGHDTTVDAKLRLLDNRDGLAWATARLAGKKNETAPQPRSWKQPQPKKPQPAAKQSGFLFPGRIEYRNPPLTLECQVKLPPSKEYNILVASDSKRSGAHWELFTMPRTGFLTAYLPGRKPDHIRSNINVCDNKPHQVALVYAPQRVRLYVDGKQVADQKIQSSKQATVPGGLGIGRLVEGNLTSTGEINAVRISQGVREITHDTNYEKDKTTLQLWKQKQNGDLAPLIATKSAESNSIPKEYDANLVAQITKSVGQAGQSNSGMKVFASAKSACVSCHRIGKQGGVVGPELTRIGKDRTVEQLVASVFWPKHEIKPEFMAHAIITDDGKIHNGYIIKRDEKTVTLKNPATCELEKIDLETIEDETRSGTLMPEGLVSAMTAQQRLDLIRFLSDLGKPDTLPLEKIESTLAASQVHAPATFEFDRKPLSPQDWPHWEAFINRDRVYDYYAKQAEHFRQLENVPHLLPEFPGLDGGTFGHWGNQHEEVWADDRWNDTILGSVQTGVFRGDGKTISRAVCVQLGDNNELSVCFNTETLTYDVLWKEGFLKFSSVRHGFMHGLLLEGTPLPAPNTKKPDKPFKYCGFYRHGKQVVFCYLIDGVKYYDVPGIENGEFTRTVFKANTNLAQQQPLQQLTRPGSPQWTQVLETNLIKGTGTPYAVDTIEVPFENPWNSLMFFGGHDFLPDGSALVCTMQGDVWQVTGLVNGKQKDSSKTSKVRWRRFASGLFHALGLVISGEEIYVLGRDQITRLHDLNKDGEADFYECFSQAFETSPAGHDFICGLQRDADGNFYTASGNQGLLRISADGTQAEVLATGFRNPDGLGLTPEKLLTVPCSEGGWTPASMICAVDGVQNASPKNLPHFGFRGPKNNQPPSLPLAYLPRGLDNSSGGQVYIDSDRWGPLKGQQIHLSFGTGAHFLLLKDKVDDQLQGAIIPLPGEFLSGAHRGRFNPADGQLYVTGMGGWGSYTIEDGNFQRVRYTGAPVNLPEKFHVHQNGITVTFTETIDKQLAEQSRSHFAQCWNYRYSEAYGSPEYSPTHPGAQGHDVLAIQSAHVLSDGKTLFLEIPDLQPVNQLHLRLHVDALNPLTSAGQDLFVTVHKLDKPFSNFPGYKLVEKTIAAHPILADMALSTKRIPNPWRNRIGNARKITLQTGKNLTFATRTIKVKAGEPLEFTLANPDVVPHNWALIKPGTLKEVGDLANRLIADPEAAVRHYIPKTGDVLYYTDVTPPQSETTIYFHAPQQPGNYPYLCTFPGHWMVMNGVLVVE